MEKECKHCNKAFVVQRIDSMYCSRSCRQMAYMVRKTALQKNVVSIMPLLSEEIVQKEISNEPILIVKEKEYESHESQLLNTIREQLNDDKDMLAIHRCIVTHEDIHSYWIGIRLRCLIECLLLFSEAKFTRVVDLMEICNAFTMMQSSIHYKSLPDLFPYLGIINNLQKKLKSLCIKVQKSEHIKFRMETEDKMELIIARYVLAQFIRKEKFRELNFE